MEFFSAQLVKTQDPSASKSHQLHVDIFWFSTILLKGILWNHPSKMIGGFVHSLEHELVISRAQLAHL